MNATFKLALTAAAVVLATQAAAEIIIYEEENFQGRSVSSEQPINNLGREGFTDGATSVVVRGGRWEVCEDRRFRGQCVVLRPGRYSSLAAMGLNDRASSARSNTVAHAPMPVADYRRRDNERLYEAPVTSARAVLDTPEQRCWVERDQVMQDRSSSNVPAAIAGALVGGILGHQVGGGTGKDLATVGGAVAGAALGAQMGRNGNAAPAQDVQRCENVPSRAKPRFWDVGYTFRGQVYYVQMTEQPGPTVTVNERGEPRS